MRFIASLFLGLTFLAGVTIGTVEIAMINCLVFLALGLLVARFVAPRWKTYGMVYGLAGAFFVSFLWPYVLIATSDDECSGDECLADTLVQVAGPTNGNSAQ